MSWFRSHFDILSYVSAVCRQNLVLVDRDILGENIAGAYQQLPLDLEEKGLCFKGSVQFETVGATGLRFAAQSARGGSPGITSNSSISS